jgi:hypothetical protein
MQPANHQVRGARIVLVAGQQCRFRLVLRKGTRLAMKPRSQVQEREVRDTVLRRT